MIFSFDPRQGLVVVHAELEGPLGSVILRLALDTGATGTMVNVGMFVAIGYDPSLTSDRIQVTTGSGVELNKITALGQGKVKFPVLCHTLPSSTSIDGLLGLDFLRGQKLTVDFRNGKINLG